MLKSPFVLMGVSILLYSLFPLAGALGIQRLDPLVFTGASHIVSLLSYAILLGSRRGGAAAVGTAFAALRAPGVAPMVAVAGIVNFTSHALLVTAFLYTSRASATIIYESWPVFGMIGTAILMSAQYERPDASKIILAVLAFAGIAIVVVSAAGRGNTAGVSLLGLALAAGSAATMAVSVAVNVKARRMVGEVAGVRNPALSASLLVRVFGVAAFLALLPFWGLAPLAGLASDETALLLVAFNGAVIVTLGSMAYREALVQARGSHIIILWYLTPLVAVGWLALFGLADITEALFLGAMFIVAGNLLLNTEADSGPAYLGVFISLAVSAAILHFVAPVPIETVLPDATLSELVGIPMALFGILSGFVLARLFARRQEKEDLLSELLSQLDGPRQTLLRALLASRRQAEADRALAALRTVLSGKPEALRAAYALRLKLARPVALGEILVIWAIAAFSGAAVLAFRAPGLVGDTIAVLTVSTLVYLSALIASPPDTDLEARAETLASDGGETRSRRLDRIAIIATILAMYALHLVLALERSGATDLLAPT